MVYGGWKYPRLMKGPDRSLYGNNECKNNNYVQAETSPILNARMP